MFAATSRLEDNAMRGGSGDSDMMDVDDTALEESTKSIESQKLITVRENDSENSTMGGIFGTMSQSDGSSVKKSELSCVAHDASGAALAVGDADGDIHIFERDGKNGMKVKETLSFKSHKRDFDYLRSLEIEQSINKIVWCPSPNDSKFLLSTNDKTIKLWKLGSGCSLPATFKVPKPSKPAKFLNRTAPPRRPTFRRPLPADQLFKRVRRNPPRVGIDTKASRSHTERRVYVVVSVVACIIHNNSLNLSKYTQQIQERTCLSYKLSLRFK